MTEPEGSDGWDVFISYAREDYQKARDIVDGLQKCATSQGLPPRIFLDVGRDGVPAGVDWVQYLEKAMRGSRYIVALYTRQYFSKAVCMAELREAVKLTNAEQAQLIPVLMEEAASNAVDFIANRYNWLPVTHPDWFQRLRDALGLRPGVARKLRFETPVPDAVVNHTLPAVRVTVTGPDGTPLLESRESVTLTTSPPDLLNGTVVASTVQATADFTDLSFRAPTGSVRLVARAPGCEPAESPPIQVSAPRPQPAGEDQVQDHPRLPTGGRPVFFPDGRSLAVLDRHRLTVHSLDDPSHARGAARLLARPRLWARGPDRLAVADWTGRVVVAAADGRTRTADLARTPGLAIPGAMAFDEDVLLVGMWNGTLWSLTDDAEPEVVLEHPGGVQILAVDGARLLVGDLAGKLTEYDQGVPTAEHRLERLLLGIHCGRDHTLLVGENHVYRLADGAARPLEIDLPVKPVADALLGPELSIALNDEGVGVSFDAELGVRLGFRTVPGARAVGTTRDGGVVVFEYPDGSHVLMHDGRIGITSDHPLAISPDGRTAASSNGEHTLIVPVEELRTGAAESKETA